MDASRFDALTRALTTSLRTTRKTFLGAGLGLLLAGRGRDAAANCKKVGRACNRDNDCCNGAECPAGVCQCKSGFEDCSGKCKDLDSRQEALRRVRQRLRPGGTCCSGDCAGDFQTDPDHCGGCGNFCRGICSDNRASPAMPWTAVLW